MEGFSEGLNASERASTQLCSQDWGAYDLELPHVTNLNQVPVRSRARLSAWKCAPRLTHLVAPTPLRHRANSNRRALKQAMSAAKADDYGGKRRRPLTSEAENAALEG